MVTIVILFALAWLIVIACCLVLAGQIALKEDAPEPESDELGVEHNIVYVGHAADGTTFYHCTCGCGWEGERG